MSEPWWTLARWAIVTGWAVFAVLVGDPVVRRVFHLAGDLRDSVPSAGPEEVRPFGPTEDAAAVVAGTDLGEAGSMGTPPPPTPTEEVTLVEAAGARLHGGRAIGWLERLGTYATLIAAFPAGLAVIIAVKGLARYPDLKASDGTAERFILGTFASLLVAAAGAGAADWCLDRLP